MQLYHATFQSYLPGIAEQGLIPDGQKNWPDCPAGFVYLANDMAGAIAFCETVEDLDSAVYDSGICCFEVDVNALDSTLLSADPNIIWEPEEDPWCFVYAGQIPYEALRLCWTETLGEIKQPLDSQHQSSSLRSQASQLGTTLLGRGAEGHEP